MWPVFRKTPEKHLIDRGRVYCPLRGRDVEIDVCAGCRWIVEVREDGKPPYLTCQSGPKPLFAPDPAPPSRQSE